jgi:Mce-associated membrane protein
VAVPPAPDGRSGVTQEETSADQDPGGDATPARATSHSLRITLLVVLLALLVASTGAVAYLAATRPVPALDIKGSEAGLQSQRESVMAQAEQFMLRVNTYGPDLLEGDTMPDYRKLVEEVITPKFAADFEENVPAAEQTVKEAGLARTCQVFSTGVSAIDADSATALVAGSFTNSYPQTAGSEERVETDPAPFRVQVSLVKIKGTWLVDDFTPLTGEDPSAAPSAAPSEGSSPAPTDGGSPTPSAEGSPTPTDEATP